MSFLWNRKQWLGFVGAVIVIGIGVWFGYYKWYLPQYGGPVARYGAMGQIEEVSASTIKISGVTMNKDGATTPETTAQKDLTILTDTNTKFVKTVVHRPSAEELAKTEGGLWDMSKVKTEIISGSFSDLTKVNSVVVKISTNNPTRSSYTASEIDYFTIVD